MRVTSSPVRSKLRTLLFYLPDCTYTCGPEMPQVFPGRSNRTTGNASWNGRGRLESNVVEKTADFRKAHAAVAEACGMDSNQDFTHQLIHVGAEYRRNRTSKCRCHWRRFCCHACCNAPVATFGTHRAAPGPHQRI